MLALFSKNLSFDPFGVWAEGCRALLDEHEGFGGQTFELAALAQGLPRSLPHAAQEHAHGLLSRVVCQVATERVPSADVAARLFRLLARRFDDRWCHDWTVLIGELQTTQPEPITAPQALTVAADTRTARALDEIEQRHADPTLRLQDVARALALSACRLTQLLKAETGRTFGAHVQRRRIAHACILLDDPALSVKEIAARVGYQTTTQLGRQFKRHTTISPLAYRRARTTPTHPAAVAHARRDATAPAPPVVLQPPTLSLTKRQN